MAVQVGKRSTTLLLPGGGGNLGFPLWLWAGFGKVVKVLTFHYISSNTTPERRKDCLFKWWGKSRLPTWLPLIQRWKFPSYYSQLKVLLRCISAFSDTSLGGWRGGKGQENTLPIRQGWDSTCSTREKSGFRHRFFCGVWLEYNVTVQKKFSVLRGCFFPSLLDKS